MVEFGRLYRYTHNSIGDRYTAKTYYFLLEVNFAEVTSE